MADTGIAGWIETHPALSIGAVVVGGLLLVGIVQSKKQAPAATTTPTQATGDLSGLQTDANGNPILYRVASDTYINTSIFEDSYNSTVDSHNQSNSNNTTTTTNNPPPPDTTPPPPTQTPPNSTGPYPWHLDETGKWWVNDSKDPAYVNSKAFNRPGSYVDSSGALHIPNTAGPYESYNGAVIPPGP